MITFKAHCHVKWYSCGAIIGAGIVSLWGTALQVFTTFLVEVGGKNTYLLQPVPSVSNKVLWLNNPSSHPHSVLIKQINKCLSSFLMWVSLAVLQFELFLLQLMDLQGISAIFSCLYGCDGAGQCISVRQWVVQCILESIDPILTKPG